MINKNPVYKFRLNQDYQFRPDFDYPFDRDFVDASGHLRAYVRRGLFTIVKGYSWDGCSPKFSVFGRLFGVYDGKHNYYHDLYHTLNFRNIGSLGASNRSSLKSSDYDQRLKYASLKHDVFCQFFDSISGVVTREEVDLQFYWDCKRVNFKLSKLYYWAVRFYSKFLRF